MVHDHTHNKYGFVANPNRSVRNNLLSHLLQLPVAGFIYRGTNTACHNLCVKLSPPQGFQYLLGLGLKFCVRPRMTCTPQAFKAMTTRFRRDIYLKTFYADQPSDLPPDQLRISSGYTPDENLIPMEIRARINVFIRSLRELFVCKSAPPNLAPWQRSLLRDLRADPTFITIPADKNLGLCIIERDEYIRRVFQDHLLDTDTYQKLTEEEAIAHMETVGRNARAFLKAACKRHDLDDDDLEYLKRSLDTKDPFAYFYGTAKVHKDPWKLRPIVSYSGSLLHGLGRWLDQQLQPYARELPTYLKSSFDLKNELEQLEFPCHQKFSMFTCDARSMYTNIDTSHALKNIGDYLRLQDDCPHAPSIMQALTLLMRNNVFRFGDTYYKQLTGTAMGAPPACAYAQLYFGIYELQVIPRFQTHLKLFYRYIDDGFGIWIHDPDPAVDTANWEQFQTEYGSFGKLIWDFSDRTHRINFLDLMITLKNGSATTTIYEKPMNLYQYIPPNSAHSPNVIRAFIFGLVLRIFRLTSRPADRQIEIDKLIGRCLARGYTPSFLKPVLEKSIARAIARMKHKPAPEPDPNDYMAHFLARSNQPPEDDIKSTVFLHTTYHHHGPKSRDIQHAFRSTFLKPSKDDPFFHELKNGLRVNTGAPVNIRRLLIAQHKVPNIKNLLFPRKLKQQEGREASKIREEIQPQPPQQPVTYNLMTVNPYS